MTHQSKLSRRRFVCAASGTLLSACSLSALGSTYHSYLLGGHEKGSISFIINRGTSFELSSNERVKLERAVLDFLSSHYSGISLQFWGLPFEQIDFEKRLKNIIYWVNKAVKHHESLYPVDPIWVLAQIKAESLFCEFAISPALAAGICQFIPNTARKGHQMIIAGDLPEHHQPPFKKTEYAKALNEYNQLIKQRRVYIKENRQAKFFTLDKALDFLADKREASQEAQRQIDYMAELATLRASINQARRNYVDYINTNITELGKRDLFGQTDFFKRFDERFTYRKPIFAMVNMLANALRVRNGNILTAAAAYNAGLSRTRTRQPIYSDYGLIPNFEETTVYISKVVANYEEIYKRYHAA